MIIPPSSSTPITSTTPAQTVTSDEEIIELATMDFSRVYDIRLKEDGPAAQQIKLVEGQLARYQQDLEALQKQLMDPQATPSVSELAAIEFRVALLHTAIRNARNDITMGHVAKYQEKIDTIDAMLARYATAPEWLKDTLLGPQALVDVQWHRNNALWKQDMYRQQLI